MTFTEWQEKHAAGAERAERTSAMILQRARRACKEAGLDPGLLGIHPHNALCSLEAGRPWAGVDYSLVRLSLRLQRLSYEPHRKVAAWSRAVWPSVQR